MDEPWLDLGLLLSDNKISHRLFAARCVALIIHRGSVAPARLSSKTTAGLRVTRDATDYRAAPVTEPHIVVALVPRIRTTALRADTRTSCVSISDVSSSMARVAAAAFGFLTLIQVFEGLPS